MDKSIGIVICNYNKQEYIINCIQSVLNSSISDFDVFVVDNASTDNSVQYIQTEFGNKVTLIVNEVNLGGSGGFNTGLRAALEKDYKYIMLMDNDIIADSKAIEELYKCIESHPETGIVGSKVFYMDYPEKIWGYGGHIDFEQFINKDHYKNMSASSFIPEFEYCDYVAACSLIVRTSAIEKVGLMPEENFIYWDDMEWGYRFNQKGYRVAVCGKSIIWHKAGGRNAENTFIHYYMWRNRIRFFLKVLDSNQRLKFADVMLTEMFRMFYSLKLKGEVNVIKTVSYAYSDAVNHVTGKAKDWEILERTKVPNRLTVALENAETLLIQFNDDFEGLENILRNIKTISENINVSISIQNCATSQEMMKAEYYQYRIDEYYNPDKYDKSMKMCNHIFDFNSDWDDGIYIDSWCNILFTKEDFSYAKSFTSMKELFIIMNSGFIINNY